MIRAAAVLLALLAALGLPAFAETDAEVAGEIVRLRSLLGASAAQERRCLAGAVPGIWAGPTAEDLRLLRDRARQMEERARSNGDAGARAHAEAWRALQARALELEAQAKANARSGADLLAAQHIGLGCLDRFAGERQALRASLELALADPAAYKASLGEAREHGTLTLRRDLHALRRSALGLAARFRARAPHAELSGDAELLRRELDGLRRRHVVALQSEGNRALADPVLRAGEALVGAVDAWGVEQRARTPGEREDAARLGRARWVTAERLLSEASSVTE